MCYTSQSACEARKPSVLTFRGFPCSENVSEFRPLRRRTPTAGAPPPAWLTNPARPRCWRHPGLCRRTDAWPTPPSAPAAAPPPPPQPGCAPPRTKSTPKCRRPAFCASRMRRRASHRARTRASPRPTCAPWPIPPAGRARGRRATRCDRVWGLGFARSFPSLPISFSFCLTQFLSVRVPAHRAGHLLHPAAARGVPRRAIAVGQLRVRLRLPRKHHHPHPGVHVSVGARCDAFAARSSTKKMTHQRKFPNNRPGCGVEAGGEAGRAARGGRFGAGLPVVKRPECL